MKRYILALGLIAFTATNAGAAIMMGYAPEALSHDAEVIFEGTPVSANTKHLIGDRYVTSVRFRVETRIKGPLSAGDTVSIMSLDWKGRTDLMDFVTAVTKKRKVLVLAKPAKNSFREAEGLYEFVPHFWNRPAFYTDEPVKWIYDEKGAAIRTYKELLSRIEAQCAKEADLLWRNWTGTISRLDVDAPWGTDACTELFAMSAVLVRTIEYLEPKSEKK